MGRIFFLKLIDKKIKGLEYEEFEAYTIITAKRCRKSVKKVLKKHIGEKIVVSGDIVNEPFIQEHIKPYDELRFDVVLSVIDTACRTIAQNLGFGLPLENVCLYSHPERACAFIKRIMGLSRMYTIVSEEEPGEELDELYFEYGYPIRHIKKPDFFGKEVVSIFIDKCGALNSGIINITENNIIAENVVNLRNVPVVDENTAEFSKTIIERPGLSLYSLLGKEILKNPTIDINKRAEKIFMLDTSGF